MKQRGLIAVIWLIFLVSFTGAAEITVEPEDEAYQLVFTADRPCTVSAYTVEVQFDPAIPVMAVESVSPFTVVSNFNNTRGIMWITGYITAPLSDADKATRIPLARIQAGSGFSVTGISVEYLDDGDRNPIPVEGRVATPAPTTPLPPLTQEGVVTPAPSPAATVPPEIDVPWVSPTPIQVTGTVLPVTVTATETIPATGGLAVTATTPPATVEAVVTGETPNQSASPEKPSQTTPLSPIPVLTGMLIAIFIVVKRRTQD
jgi:hypothetical protein